ncbi:hypothetical protein SAMN04515679_2413 [Pelosinus fermentans]|uniref:Uncharacterized protein n=1 Tax=Pelosinus fermentans B4 TaxID=1149862 RepID=I8RFH6_9FIRM|nr:hypothetical protein FB4_3452 [Pelosinus fermentans B4]EIW24264.1 hypothetical protein FA11_3453 [Pelosinus fermentans A11]OAM94290.1 hypothetical protein FR7_02308 [Pelosinus fermentans DSM 17108]SDR05293.1 hypothetical protein SAMN04515679_2413 [Pelosinus fermentans]
MADVIPIVKTFKRNFTDLHATVDAYCQRASR